MSLFVLRYKTVGSIEQAFGFSTGSCRAWDGPGGLGGTFGRCLGKCLGSVWQGLRGFERFLDSFREGCQRLNKTYQNLIQTA